MAIPQRVKIVEVGPRDGLQNEARNVETTVKVELINRLAEAGCKNIEVGAFVSPKWVPQMANTVDVLAALPKRDGSTYSVLVPNMRGLEAAMESGVKEISIFAAASETFSRKNVNAWIDESFVRFEPVVTKALKNGMRVRGYVSTVLGCPYEGEIAPEKVVDVSHRLFEIGCYEISLGDTIGVGTPGKACKLVEAVAKRVPLDKLALHFHDTYGQALANIYACLDLGVGVIDSSVAGLGGCPYAPGASGNVATEDVVYMLDGIGVQTGIELKKLAEAGWFINDVLGRAPSGRVSQALRSACKTD